MFGGSNASILGKGIEGAVNANEIVQTGANAIEKHPNDLEAMLSKMFDDGVFGWLRYIFHWMGFGRYCDALKVFVRYQQAKVGLLATLATLAFAIPFGCLILRQHSFRVAWRSTLMFT